MTPAPAESPDAGAWEATRVVAIRHGETEWNVGSRIQGQLDIPLNAHGRWQAERLAEALVGEGIEAIVSSDLLRARQTAEAIGRRLDLPVVTDIGLRERGFGIFEGQTWDEIAERWPIESARWRRRDPDFGAEGGETLTAFFDRSVTTARRLATAHAGKTIALVAHGGVMDCFYRAATRLALGAPRSWLLGNAAINRLLHTPQGFTLVGWSDTQHLDDMVRDEADGPPGAEPSRPA